MRLGWTGRRMGPAVLSLLLLAAGMAPWLSPRPPDLQEDVAGARYLPPLTRAHALRTAPHRTRIVTELRRTRSGWEFMRAGTRETIPLNGVQGPPSPRLYLLGTDSLGRDLTSRLLFGARHSVGIALLSVALALVLGIGVGSTAALAGGWWDSLLMRGVDVLMSIPRVLVFLVCAALFRPSTPLLIAVLAATTWTGLARVVRGEVLALGRNDFVLAARAAGSPFPRILVFHLLPQMAPVVIVTASLRFADTILLESALALLGLGSPPPTVSLGSIMASGRDALAQAWWIVAWPGLLLCAATLALRSTGRCLVRLEDPPSMS